MQHEVAARHCGRAVGHVAISMVGKMVPSGQKKEAGTKLVKVGM
jgi:hypothetical protein